MGEIIILVRFKFYFIEYMISNNKFIIIMHIARYDPVELDPEEMCKMAKEQPQVPLA